MTIGSPQTVDVSHFKFHARATDRFGTHDRIGIVPASSFNFGERWEGERCFLWCEGVMRQEIVYGENLSLTRRYEAELGTSTFTLHDIVRNDGYYPTPINTSTTSTSAIPSSTTAPSFCVPPRALSRARSSTTTRRRVERYRTFSGPEKEFFAEGYEIPMTAATDGLGVGRGREPGLQRGSTVASGSISATTRSTLPVYLEWRMMGEGLYAVGMEPSSNPFGEVAELIEAGWPLMLEPGEERSLQSRVRRPRRLARRSSGSRLPSQPRTGAES